MDINHKTGIETSANHQELINAIFKSFISSKPIHVLLENTLEMLGNYMQLHKIVITTVDDKINRVYHAYGWVDEDAGIVIHSETFPFQPGQLIFDSFITNKKPYVVCEDTRTNPEFNVIAQDGVRAFIMIPIITAGQLWGAISVNDCRNARHWDDSDIQLSLLISNVLSELITRHEIENQLMKMTSIMENSPQCIAYINKEGKVEYVNKGAEKLTGYTQEELLHDNLFSRLFLDSMVQNYNEESKSKLSSLDEWDSTFEVPLVFKGGEIRTLLVSCFIADAKTHSWGLVASDITERRHLEQELLMAKNAAEQASKAKSEFLSRMSHEMKTPMNAIIGMNSIAKGCNDIVKKDRCLDRIDDASKHLLEVINDILDMSKIEANKFELHSHEFNLEKMLMKVANGIQFHADQKRQNIIIKLNQNVPLSIVGDEQRLAQVITNLLSNAVKFTDNHGIIHLDIDTTEQIDGNVILQVFVTDNGIGMTEEQQAKLFTSFEQVDGSISRTFGGTGLGLAISKRIVEMMGGTIWAESEYKKGTKFTFTAYVKKGSENYTSALKQGPINNESKKYAKGKSHMQENNVNQNENIKKDLNNLDIPSYIDWESGLQRLVGKKELYLKLLNSFKGKQMAEELAQAINEGDHQTVRQISHALKGTSANLGLIGLTEIAAKIEQQAKAELDATFLVSSLNEIMDKTADVVQFILENGGL